MWLRFLRTRKDNPLFVQACRRLRRRWWRSWVAPALLVLAALYGFLILAQLGIGFAPAIASPASGFDSAAILRLFLIVLTPLLTLAAYVAGVKSVQREREQGTLETLLLTDLTNIDLITGKVLGALLPFFLASLLLLPAVLQFGVTASPQLPALFTKNWRLQGMLEAFWYLPHWELLANIFFGAVLGVVYGIHRAAHYRRPSLIYSFGMITFLIFVTFGLQMLSNLFQAMVEIPAGIIHMTQSNEPFDFTPYQPLVRVIGGAIATWLLTLMPLFELADQFRYLVEEEQDPRYLRFRPRPSPAARPVPWTERKPQASAHDIWAEEWEKRGQTRARPHSAILPRNPDRPPNDPRH